VTRRAVDAVLCDRDGTLIVDVPYNGDPDRVAPMATVPAGLGRLRAAGLPVAVVSNQSGLARGDFGHHDLVRVMYRVDELLGPFDAIVWCPHGPDDGCPCRKPAPGMVHEAARLLAVDPAHCAVIGDTAADVGAAEAAGAWGILVPNERTLPGEVEAAAHVAATFAEAVDLVLAP
jgi:histidinol-phosphate phosphatase family protein